MTNPHRGTLTLQGADKTWTFRFSTNAMVALETELGMGVSQIIAALGAREGVSIAFVRTMFWAGLLDGDPSVSQDKAGKLIDEIGTQRAGEMIGEAFALAFPKVEAGDGARPPKGARPGTGRRS